MVKPVVLLSLSGSIKNDISEHEISGWFLESEARPGERLSKLILFLGTFMI